MKKIIIELPGGAKHSLPGDTPYDKVGEYISLVEKITHPVKPLKIEEEDNVPCNDVFDFLK